MESQTQSLSVSRVAVERCLMRKGTRVFALLGRATSSGIASFGPDDVSRSWAVTSERGSIRLEKLSGDEELTGLELSLPTPACYDYGIAGVDASPAVTRAVFGLLPAELERIVAVMRRNSFPVLGFSSRPLKCSISGGIIPACWPHVVLSNQALYGNVICLESFVRIVVSSLPQGRLAERIPALQPMLKQLMMLVVAQRRGLPYTEEILNLTPAEALVGK